MPQLFKKRGLDATKSLDLLEKLSAFIYEIEMIFLEQFRKQAEQRIAMRDPNDWSIIIACAMLLKCPIWTEDTDFLVLDYPFGQLTVCIYIYPMIKRRCFFLLFIMDLAPLGFPYLKNI